MTLRLLFIYILYTSFSFSQTSPEVQSNWNRIFAKHYLSNQLSDTYENSLEVYEAINYYFKESFSAKVTDCETCTVDIDELLNYKIFDVYEYEVLRLEEAGYSFEYKEYTITLLPKNVVYSQLSGLLPSELVNFVSPRDFPTFSLTNDDNAEYLNYKEKVYSWARDFPDEYRTMTNSDNLLKISIRDFLELTNERKLMILNHANGYLIID